MKKKILIIGINGFLGRALAEYFACKNYDIIGFDRSNYNSDKKLASPIELYQVSLPGGDISGILNKIKPDFSIFAAGSSSVMDSIDNPYNDFYQSANSLVYFLDNLRLYSPKTKTIFFSSAAVYGNTNKIPICETVDLNPVSPYGYHKLVCENVLSEFYNIYNVHSVIMRIFSVYGEGLRSRIFWDLSNKINFEKSVELHGTGKETRDFLYINDFCKAVEIILMNSSFENEVFNLGSGIEISIFELASKMIALYDIKKEVSFSSKVRKGDPLNWRADIEKIKKYGFAPEIDIATGLAEYVKWYKEINAE